MAARHGPADDAARGELPGAVDLTAVLPLEVCDRVVAFCARLADLRALRLTCRVLQRAASSKVGAVRACVVERIAEPTALL